MNAIYNEIEPFAVDWLGNLIEAGHIAPGLVDSRSIRDVRPDEVRGDGQRHFFAGIGAWSHALRLAGWPDDVPVWTGSCPCQPFSDAGTGGGFADDRHLWPVWFDLILECRPTVVFGEQVASKAGLEWLDLVRSDLEGAGYAVGAADLCAASVGAPHIRQRLYFVAYASGERREGVGVHVLRRRPHATGDEAPRGGAPGELGDASSPRGGRDAGAVPCTQGEGSRERRVAGDLADLAVDAGAIGRLENADVVNTQHGDESRGGGLVQPATHATAGFWHPADWIFCSDGKARPVEPGTFPLADGATARMGRLRAYGNAIVAPLAAEFIGSVMDVLGVSP